MSDEQLRMLIFEPGFSTKEEISDLSGRRWHGCGQAQRPADARDGQPGERKRRGAAVTIGCR